MPPKLTVVISQAHGKNPVKRQLEEELATRLLMEPGIDVSVVPHLYDMPTDHTGYLFLRGTRGPLVVLGWLFPRALRWTLDRQGVRGKEGISLLVDESDEDEIEEPAAEDQPNEAIGPVDVPNRHIYCIDMRVETKAAVFLDELNRIKKEQTERAAPLVGLSLSLPNTNGSQNGNAAAPQQNGSSSDSARTTNGKINFDELLPANVANGHTNGSPTPANGAPTETDPLLMMGELHSFADDEVKRRWYPVIDYSRCTNCMECIDFCLFGVYGVDNLDRILVEAQDSCKKGCPACSRVCPENAIIFPQHKTPAIAGAEGEVAGMKIDLSKLFGGEGRDAVDLAVAERDAELVLDGRDAVGATVGLAKRQVAGNASRDELDDLMDNLDALDV